MKIKEYKRIPVFPKTKKAFDVAKAESDCETQDEFVNELLVCRDIMYQPMDMHYIKCPSVEIALRDTNGRIWITRGRDNKNWVDITDIIPE